MKNEAVFENKDNRTAIFFTRCSPERKAWLEAQVAKGKWKSMANLFEKIVDELMSRGETRFASRKTKLPRNSKKAK